MRPYFDREARITTIRLYEGSDTGWVRVSFQAPEDRERWRKLEGEDWVRAGLNREQPLARARQFADRLRAELIDCRVSIVPAVRTNPSAAACPACHD